MAAKKKFKASSDEWQKPSHTSTRTEIQTSANMANQDLLQQAQQEEPALVVVQGESVGRVIRLKLGTNILGRHPESDVQLPQRAVSGAHAEIRVAAGSVILEDLKSTNGTLLNKDLVTRPAVLQAGDLIKIGNSVFKYIDNKLDASFAESLHLQSSTDPLTGISNKAYVMKALNSSMEVARTGYPLSVILFDLDHFKNVNDTHGHIAGDYVLKETCRVIKDTVVRSDDVFGRFGGEEFLVVMPDSPLQIAVGVAERIRKTMESHHYAFAETRIPVTASLGVASWKPEYTTAEEFLEAVDKLLYKSKQGGRNRVTEPT